MSRPPDRRWSRADRVALLVWGTSIVCLVNCVEPVRVPTWPTAGRLAGGPGPLRRRRATRLRRACWMPHPSKRTVARDPRHGRHRGGMHRTHGVCAVGRRSASLRAESRLPLRHLPGRLNGSGLRCLLRTISRRGRRGKGRCYETDTSSRTNRGCKRSFCRNANDANRHTGLALVLRHGSISPIWLEGCGGCGVPVGCVRVPLRRAAGPR